MDILGTVTEYGCTYIFIYQDQRHDRRYEVHPRTTQSPSVTSRGLVLGGRAR